MNFQALIILESNVSDVILLLLQQGFALIIVTKDIEKENLIHYRHPATVISTCEDLDDTDLNCWVRPIKTQ